MKKEQKTEIATNVSSGAEKVESVEKQVKKTQKTTPKNATKLGGEQKTQSQTVSVKAKKENDEAQARVQTALKKQEKKKLRAEAKAKAKKEKAEARKALQEKRRAEKKALQEKRAKERKALQEKRREAREEKIRERAHQKANRAQRRSRAKSKRENERKEHRSNREKGYGGWIATVVALGAVTLGLTTAVTIGAIDMKSTKDGVTSGYRSTSYELIGLMENVDNDLDRVRICATPEQQGRVLTDLLVQVRLAELDLEKMPITAESDRNVTSFLNRVGATCERLLAKLRDGERLNEDDQATLQRLYEINHGVRAEIEKIVTEATEKDFTDYLKKGTGMLAEAFQRLEKMTLDENGLLGGVKQKMQEAGTQPNAPTPRLEEGEKGKINPAKAEDLCKSYFSAYKISEFQCVGETVSKEYGAYNVQGYDDNGTLLFAEIDYKNGALLRFDYFEDCNEETFDYDNAQRIAEEFLEKLGYDDMEAVRVRNNGTDADFTFVYEDDDVLFYPDTVRVKVCRTRGIVTGMDATKYLKNHKDRADVKTSVSLAEARAKLHEGLSVDSARVAVVQTARGERVAYEFLCSYQEERYLIYIDGNDGREISIVNVKNVG